MKRFLYLLLRKFRCGKIILDEKKYNSELQKFYRNSKENHPLNLPKSFLQFDRAIDLKLRFEDIFFIFSVYLL